jgi:hypothetical protein
VRLHTPEINSITRSGPRQRLGVKNLGLWWARIIRRNMRGMRSSLTVSCNEDLTSTLESLLGELVLAGGTYFFTRRELNLAVS